MISIVDEFMNLKNPTKFEELSEETKKHISSFRRSYKYLENRAAENGEDLGAFLGRSARERKKEFLLQFDTTVLDAMGMTVDDLIHMQELKAKRKRESGVGPQKRTIWAMDTAIRAFLISESRGHTYAEAVNFAIEQIALEHDREPGEKQVRRWLNELQEWRVTTIPPPRK